MTSEEAKEFIRTLIPTAEALRSHPFWNEESASDHLANGFMLKDEYAVAKIAAVAVMLLADAAKEKEGTE